MKKSYALLAAVLLMACQHSQRNEPVAHAVMLQAPPPLLDAVSEAKDPSEQFAEEDRALIREAHMTLEVSRIKNVGDTVKRTLQQYHAYIANERRTIDERGIHNAMLIRVGDQQFEPLLRRLESMAIRVTDRSITTQDVTLEFTDLTARLASKKELETRYRQILQQAKTVKDMLAIEEQLGATREEIESMEARHKRMANQIAYCTVDVIFTERTIAPPTGFARELNTAWNDGWKALTNLLLKTISLWPWLVLVASVVAVVIRHRVKRRALAV